MAGDPIRFDGKVVLVTGAGGGKTVIVMYSWYGSHDL
jgi:F0F1-type ATP synthase beta subunit